MDKKYSLCILKGDANTLEEGVNSRDMLVSSLLEEFSKMPNVTVLPYNIANVNNENIDEFVNNFPECDIALVRLFTQSSVVQNIEKIKHKVGKKLCSFIEVRQDGMDYCFAFLRVANPDYHIAYPYPEKFMTYKTKKKKTILLDDMVGWWTDDTAKIICKWLEPLIGEYKIYQLTRDKPVADFLEPIKLSNYKSYMEATSEMEFFIQTHYGSYEHSILDMVGRGVRPLIIKNSPSLIPQEMIDDLEIETYTSQQELIELIKTPIDEDVLIKKKDKMTPMKDVTQMLHKKFLEWNE